jgi:thiamine-phosphate pyrophosphorylase
VTRHPRWRGLYAIVDPALCRGRPPLLVADAILAGGCAVLQLRAKELPQTELEPLAHALAERCRAADVPFVVNDSPELARAVGAAGVHLGQTDMAIASARAIVGDASVIGVSTHDLAQAHAAEAGGADLIGFGPVFATTSKRDPDPVVGLSGLRAACAAVRVPVVAIGGVTLSNAAAVAAEGASLGAAIAALCQAEDPAAAARAMHRALRQGARSAT